MAGGVRSALQEFLGEKFFRDKVHFDKDVVISGKVTISNLTAYANNAAAIAGGLKTGDLYLLGDTVGVVH
jgi:UDP-3-O-[3-hydroxymyristoyl] glucosamine N-acyltransferase